LFLYQKKSFSLWDPPVARWCTKQLSIVLPPVVLCGIKQLICRGYLQCFNAFYSL